MPAKFHPRAFPYDMKIYIQRLFCAAALCIIGSILPVALFADSHSFAEGDANRGELMFHVSGCRSCHESETQNDDSNAPAVLGGGRRFETEFGTFIAPNISPHPETGIGSWTVAEFIDAMQKGLSPDGEHYYPVFPYASYARMAVQDVVDLKAYLDTLPESSRPNNDHELSFPYNIRFGMLFWKVLYLDADPVAEVSDDPKVQRGQYLVEGPGHCAECHTARDWMGGLDTKQWLAGGPNPDGDGRIPNITPHEDGIAEWSEADIAEYLSSGFTPEYDVVGGSMADVVENTSHLSKQDRLAIAAYLKSLPPWRP